MTQPVHEHPSFSEFITELSHGQVEQRLTEELAELTTAVEETGKVGTLTIKIHIKKEGSVAAVACESDMKKPKHPIHGSILHFGQNGALLREDPRQMKLKNLDPPKVRVLNQDSPFQE